jgi:hypothetical protein
MILLKKNKESKHEKHNIEYIPWLCGFISAVCFMSILWIVIDAMSK